MRLQIESAAGSGLTHGKPWKLFADGTWRPVLSGLTLVQNSHGRLSLRQAVGYRGRPLNSRTLMPYKANEPRRRKIPKARYKIENWAEYDAALRRLSAEQSSA